MPTFVKEILDLKGRAVITVEPSENIGAIAKILHQNGIGGVVVSDASLKILGIFTERDFVRAIAQHGEGAMSRPVGDVMTREVISCREDSTTDQLMTTMTGGRFRHVPVEADGKLVGIISIGDVVKARIREVENEANEIKAYIAG
jgi:CBS domain-containing protein